MKYLLIFLISIQSIIAQEINKLDNKGLKHGVWKGNYEASKRPRYEGTFDHGKEIGIFKFYDDTKAKTIIATREFNSNDNSCYTIFYNQKNNKVSEGKLVNKIYEGEWKYYHEDSPLIMTTELYVKGKLNGVRKVFFKNEKIAEEATYKNGLKDGSYKKYAENGIVLEESFYKNDQYEGLAIFRTAENLITAKGIFKNGQKSGIWEFTKDGKTSKENMDKPQGKKFVKQNRKQE
jgi:antitoxin component YwqK of YwqJK toxin-antitoxin module